MRTQDQVRCITERVLQPLSPATEKLFKPLLEPQDCMSVDLSEDGTRFICHTFQWEVVWETDWRDIWRVPVCYWGGVRREGGPSFRAARSFPLRIPERWELAHRGYGWWEFAATDFTALVINALWTESQLQFTPEARIAYDYLLLRFVRQTASSVTRAQFHADGDMPPYNYIDREERPLAPYQRIATHCCMRQEGQALFMEQGTGKTPVVIARICNEARETDHMYRALVVAPKNVRTNWRNEFIRFATVPGKVIILRGGQLERTKLLLEAMQREDDCEWTCVVCSYESVERTWEALRMIEWDLGVLDESHYIKSTYTKRYKRMMLLREKCKQRMCLTGTPICNSLLDLYAQLEFLGEGLSGFESWRNFRSYYGQWVKRGRFNVLTAYKNVPLIQERLARLSMMIRKSAALPDLPEKMPDVVEVEMTKEQAETYRAVQQQLAVEIRNDLDGTNRSLIITNVLTKLLRLAQITSGFVSYDAEYDDEGEEAKERFIDRVDPNPKIEALVNLLKEKGPHEKTIVWACWVQDIKTIEARLRLEGIDCVTYYGATSEADRETAEERFNGDPTCKVFIGNPAAGGTGLNLLGYDWKNTPDSPDECNHVVYFSQNWSMTSRAQSEDRTHRLGTRCNVRYTDLCVPGTIDEEIRARVTGKRQVAFAIQDVREIMQRVLELDEIKERP